MDHLAGPQVLIDAQATPLANGLMINWDVRVEAFPPGVPEAMFAYEVAELARLAADDAAWDEPDPPALAEAARAPSAMPSMRPPPRPAATTSSTASSATPPPPPRPPR